ncbi:MAG: hypothetical protein SCM96_15655 [Acidobacteriota bacterium]|nr:hypothetical protein [Acidobacteriota bacterium]
MKKTREEREGKRKFDKAYEGCTRMKDGKYTDWEYWAHETTEESDARFLKIHNEIEKKSQLLQAFQSRTARISVGASTVRGRGNAGVVAAARRHLRQLDLSMFGQPQFFDNLNVATIALRDSLPSGARHWGLARKVLNIFLRDCLYNTYLDAAFGLSKNLAYFEIPLDGITAVHLKRAAGRGMLPAWPGVKHLAEPLSVRYQEAATAEAGRRGIPRVHLDAIWWSVSRDEVDEKF